MTGISNYDDDKKEKVNNKLSANLIISKAFEYHANGDIAAARKFYQFLIDKGYKDPRVFTNYGNIEQEDNKISESKNLYKIAINLDPNIAEIYPASPM